MAFAPMLLNAQFDLVRFLDVFGIDVINVVEIDGRFDLVVSENVDEEALLRMFDLLDVKYSNIHYLSETDLGWGGEDTTQNVFIEITLPNHPIDLINFLKKFEFFTVTIDHQYGSTSYIAVSEKSAKRLVEDWVKNWWNTEFDVDYSTIEDPVTFYFERSDESCSITSSFITRIL